MTTERRFPILLSWHDEDVEVVPPPWAMLEEHEKQAQINHSQSLARLASRGGLGPDEMVAILEDRRWTRMSIEDAVGCLNELIAAWKGE